MRWLISRYTHVPLAAASVVVLVAVLGWLLVDRLVGPWPRWRGLATPPPSVVAIPAAPGPADGTPPERAPGPGQSGLPAASAPAAPRAPTPEQYALESGPFPAGETVDHLEAELNRLGHATVRFRKEDTARFFVVTATGFGSADEARQAAREIGRGTVVEEGGAPEVVLGRHPSRAAAGRPDRSARADSRCA